jgi:hypothetical protein
MKQCVHCKEFKPEEEFAYSNKILKSRQKHCRNCMSYFHQKNYASRSAEVKKEAYNRNKDRVRKGREYVWNYLKGHPCVDCGEADPKVLEFDHIEPVTKTASISRMVSDGYSIERIQEEIDLCEVRCANCHRRKHYEDKGWFSG